MPTYALVELPWGGSQKVVGSISQYATLGALLPTAEPVCDFLEVRLDQIGAGCADWLARCRTLDAERLPVILTLRSSSEGGKWDGSDKDRLAILDQAIHALATVDVEAASSLCAPVCAMAARLGKPVIVSFHDFEKTPTLRELGDRLAAMRAYPNAIPKLATMIRSAVDVDVLTQLLAQATNRPLCLIGMGPAGKDTRISLAMQGSCLTYGYLDQTAAPGQWPAADLFMALRKQMPAYNAYAMARHKIVAL